MSSIPHATSPTPAGSKEPPRPTPQLRLPDIEPDRLPRHVAIIMDGNGRWAIRQGLPRVYGHRSGAKAVRAVVTEAAQLGLNALTLYSFSIENWKRPRPEIDFLMALYVEYLVNERREMLDNNIRFVQCGRREGLPETVLHELDKTAEATRDCNGLTLALAINYGARAEITDAVRTIARLVEAGRIDPDEIDEHTIAQHMYVPEIPDPDLLIRTAGEMRVSNYLLWQISYAEIYVTEVCWPDFSVDDFHAAIRDYVRRRRRYGALDDSNS